MMIRKHYYVLAVRGPRHKLTEHDLFYPNAKYGDKLNFVGMSPSLDHAREMFDRYSLTNDETSVLLVEKNARNYALFSGPNDDYVGSRGHPNYEILRQKAEMSSDDPVYEMSGAPDLIGVETDHDLKYLRGVVKEAARDYMDQSLAECPWRLNPPGILPPHLLEDESRDPIPHVKRELESKGWVDGWCLKHKRPLDVNVRYEPAPGLDGYNLKGGNEPVTIAETQISCRDCTAESEGGDPHE